MAVPDDFLLAVQKSNAASFFALLSKTHLYAIALKLHTAQTPETRQRRFAALLQTLETGQTPRP